MGEIRGAVGKLARKSEGALTVSVVIPTFNRGAQIAAALDSVLNQTLAPLEIIVVDDGSIDETANWIAANYGNRVRLIRQENGGVARARNRGLREAKGEWIAFLDHDDQFLPDKLAMLAPLACERVGAIVSRWREIENGVAVRESPSENPKNAFSWLFGWNNPIVSMSVPLVRRDLLLQIGGFDPHCAPADDWDLWLRLARRSEFVFCDVVLTNYYLHDGQQRLDGHRMFRATRRVLGKHPLQLGRRPLLLWWFLWSGAFCASLPFYDAAKSGAPLLQNLRGAFRCHPLALLSPQWLALLLRSFKSRL